MRKYLIAPALIATVFVGYVSLERSARAQDVPVPGERAAPPPRDIADAETLRTDLEVLRRILVSKVVAEETGTTSGDLTYRIYGALGRSAAPGLEVFYAKGAGLIVQIDVDFAVGGAPVTSTGVAESKKPTLWESVLAEVEGRPRTADPNSATQPAYDAEKVAKLETALFETLGAFAGNVRALGGDEHVTVIVRGRTRSRAEISLRQVISGTVLDQDGNSVAGALPLLSGSAGNSRSRYALTIGTESSHWTVRLRAADVRRAAAGGMSVDELRGTAVQCRY
jgi:hypothetical protein